MIQFFILVTGCVAIYLTQQKNDELKIYAPLVGLLGQPFWFYMAYDNDQYGVLLLTFFYTYAWYIGVKNNIKLGNYKHIPILKTL